MVRVQAPGGSATAGVAAPSLRREAPESLWAPTPPCRLFAPPAICPINDAVQNVRPGQRFMVGQQQKDFFRSAGKDRLAVRVGSEPVPNHWPIYPALHQPRPTCSLPQPATVSPKLGTEATNLVPLCGSGATLHVYEYPNRSQEPRNRSEQATRHSVLRPGLCGRPGR